MPFCNVIIYSYHYLLDPKIAERVSKELSKDCIVVFDEAHNIDNVCIESMSIDLTEDSLRKATRGANNLERKIEEMKSSDADKLQNEYAKLVEGLRDADEARQEDAFMANPGNRVVSFSHEYRVLTYLSLARRPAQRSRTWQHTESGAFHYFLKAVCGISQGTADIQQHIRDKLT